MADPKAEKPAARTGEVDPSKLSLQAHFSTYAPAPDDKDAPQNPPSGPRTEQTLGVPVEDAATTAF